MKKEKRDTKIVSVYSKEKLEDLLSLYDDTLVQEYSLTRPKDNILDKVIDYVEEVNKLKY